ncbi:MAG: DNA polymerase I [Brasilonema octagenarum HA4186-MV1]|jgi:DNA polymerase-1|nr:DNA polymerase I [Brasilonema octagenarum HA4186-MV1]
MSQTIPTNQLASDSLTTTRPTFILVDGHSLAYRSYFAFAKGRDGGLRTKTGIPTSVCFGFLKSLLEVMATQQPQAMAIAFDLGLPTFRHEAYDRYKANRPETPEDFIPDLKNLHELLDALNLKIVTAARYEADDVLGTLAQQAAAAGYQVKIVSGDKDLFQLIDTEKQISVLYLSADAFKSSKASLKEFDPQQVKEKLGILPSQVVDFKALCGDKSDNIPGVRGIGEKTATKWLNEYGSLDQIYAALHEIKGTLHTKLEAGKEDAHKSRYLAEIVLNVPLEVDLENCILKGFDISALTPILEKLEFKSFLGKINELQQRFGGQIEQTPETETNEPISIQLKPSTNNEDDDSWFFTAEDTANQQQPSVSTIKPDIINTPEKLTELVSRLQTFTDTQHPVAWDTETTSLEPRDADLVGIGCCWGTEPDEMAYIPLGHKVGDNLNKDIALEALRPILESADYPKALQNAKFDRLVLRCQGIRLVGVVFDSMLASYVHNPDSNHNLSDLAQRYLSLTAKSYTDLVPKGKTIADVDIPSVADYCGMDVYVTFQLVAKLREELEKIPALHKLLVDVEQPLEPVLAEMEYQGISINTAYLQELSQQLETDLAKFEQKVYEIAGEKFNLGSPKQLSQILFEKLGLSTKYSRKIKTGHSTDAATLEKLQEGDTTGIIDAIIEYRTLSKLKSTYVDALPKLVRQDTHRVHTSFNQTVTSTGRLSSSDPNLQNIPIRTAFSRQIRKAFVPESGMLMVAADYSQIELRILAHLSQEPVLVEAYQQNEDIHTVTARLVFEKENVTSEERRLAKTINFGVIYGMGSLRFSRSTGVDKANANEFIKRFNSRYPKVFEYLEGVKKQAISQGYVETILGRRRYFDFTSNNIRKYKGNKPEDIDLKKLGNVGAEDAGLLRAAANAPIQGSSADIIKIAMVKLHEVLQSYQTRLLLQVHDELVFEVPPEEWEELQPHIKSVMESAVSLSVPLIVDVRVGDNWMETK